MIKILKVLLLSVCSFLIASNAVSATTFINIGYVGTKETGTCSDIVWANQDTHQNYWTSITVGGVGTVNLKMLNASGGIIAQQSYDLTRTNWSVQRDMQVTSQVAGVQVCLTSGEEAFFVTGKTNNPNAETAEFAFTDPSTTPSTGGDSGGSTGGGTGGSTGAQCIGCDMFECPGWNDYMGKVDEIINRLDWEVVTDVFNRKLIGDTPPAPSPPPQMDPITIDPDYDTIELEMPEDVELHESGFTKEDLEKDLPEIEIKEDPNDGFDIKNPIDSLPVMPDKMPIPGETDAGEWDNQKPKEESNPFPVPKELEPTQDTGNPPLPQQNEEGPPTTDTGGSAPVPESGPEGSVKYKTHPNNLDGV